MPELSTLKVRSEKPNLIPDQLGPDQLGLDQLGPDQLGLDQLDPRPTWPRSIWPSILTQIRVNSFHGDTSDVGPSGIPGLEKKMNWNVSPGRHRSITG